MKRLLLLIVLLWCISLNKTYAQFGKIQNEHMSPTSIGIVMYSNDTETVWNALRLANFSKSEGDTVSIFLLGKGVELDSMIKFDENIKKQSEKFLDTGGTILGCGTCLKSRKNNAPQVCEFSTLRDLYLLIRKNKIVLTF